MRGADTFSEGLFTLKKLDDFVPASHPLRVDPYDGQPGPTEMGEVFAQMRGRHQGGRPSIAPESCCGPCSCRCCTASARERQLMEQTQAWPAVSLVHWPVDGRRGVGATVFSKNRERLIEHDAVVGSSTDRAQAGRQEAGGCPGEHFSVDGTLIKKSLGGPQELLRKDGRMTTMAAATSEGKSRSNETHESSTDPDSRLYRKGKTPASCATWAIPLMENRNGLIVNAVVSAGRRPCRARSGQAMVADVRQANPEGEIRHHPLGSRQG